MVSSNLTMKVEGAPGAGCTEIIREMCRLSSRVGIDVSADLNGVTTTARPFCDVDRLCKDWQEEMASDRKYKYVSGKPATLHAVGKSGEC